MIFSIDATFKILFSVLNRKSLEVTFVDITVNINGIYREFWKILLT